MAPELWNQKSYLARAVSLDHGTGIRDEGIVPLADFVDTEGPAAAAIAVDLLVIGLIGAVVIVTRSGLFRTED